MYIYLSACVRICLCPPMSACVGICVEVFSKLNECKINYIMPTGVLLIIYLLPFKMKSDSIRLCSVVLNWGKTINVLLCRKQILIDFNISIDFDVEFM